MASPWSVAAIALALLLSVACSQEHRPREAAALEPIPAPAADSPWASFAARPAVWGLEVVEPAQDGRVIAGVRRPAPLQSSADLVFDAALYEPDGTRVALPIAGGLLDARFALAPSSKVALLDARKVLWVWESGKPLVRLDDGVFTGFAFSHNARFLMASKGLAPELDAWIYDLDTGAASRLTTFGTAVWGFAFSPDDTRALFVGSHEGFPSLYLIDPATAQLSKLTNRGTTEADVRSGTRLAPFPDSRRPPVWTASAVYVEDAGGVHAIDSQGKVVLSIPGASGLHRGAQGKVLFAEGDQLRSLP